MTNFTGTAGADIFVGTDFVQDIFYFDTTTLQATDTIDAGANTGTMADVMHLDAGSYDPPMFASVNGIDSIQLDGASTLILDTALLAQGGIEAYDNRLEVRTSSGDDIIDATGAHGGGMFALWMGGNDTIYGSEDSDFLSSFLTASGSVTFHGNSGDDIVYLGGDLNGTSIHELDGGSGDDELHLSGNGTLLLDLEAAGYQYSIDGGNIVGSVAGFERYYAQTGRAVMLGSSGDNRFWGFDGDDTLAGRDGDDTLTGGEGDDTLRGGEGDDVLDGEAGRDGADYGDSRDRLDIDLERTGSEAIGGGATGTDTLIDIEDIGGGKNDDILAGDLNDNLLMGRQGDDILLGRAGDDTLLGGSGNDILDAGIGTDTLDGGNGNDTVDYSDANLGIDADLHGGFATDGVERFHTLSGLENANGSDASDTLTGTLSANVLRGNDGDDTLSGLDGDDTLFAGSGLDTLTGGSDADTFVFSDTGSGFGDDVVTDFEDGIDTLVFVGVDSVSVNDVGADALVNMYDNAGNLLDTVVVSNAAGLVDASDYLLWA